MVSHKALTMEDLESHMIVLPEFLSIFALLTEEKHLSGIAAQVVERVGDIPIYAGRRGVLGTAKKSVIIYQL